MYENHLKYIAYVKVHSWSCMVLKWMMCTDHYSISYRMLLLNFPQSFRSMPIHLNPNIQSLGYPSAFPLLDYHTVGSIQHTAFGLTSFSQESTFAFPPKLICNVVAFFVLIYFPLCECAMFYFSYDPRNQLSRPHRSS